MNIWLKSLLAGTAVTIAFYFISQQLNKNKIPGKYTLECTIKAVPDSTSRHPFSIPVIIKMIAQRLEAANYDYEIKETKENNINLSLFGMTDTLSPFNMFISNGRVQFREVYSMDDLSPMLTAAMEEMKKAEDSVTELATTPKKDSVSKDISYLVEKMEEEKKKKEAADESKNSLIEFSPVYSSNSYPAEIGRVRIKDTAAARNLFEHSNVKKISRRGIQFCFGQPVKTGSNQSQEWQAPIFFLKPLDEAGSVLLGNEDILKADVSFSPYSGRPEIALQFTKAGSARWAYMTRKNIDKHLAILLNDYVVSAPKVLSAIEDGASTISGAYSVDECKMLSIALKSNKLPANLQIITSTIKSQKSKLVTTAQLLVLLICFAVCTGVAFFIFKTLKAT